MLFTISAGKWNFENYQMCEVLCCKHKYVITQSKSSNIYISHLTDFFCIMYGWISWNPSFPMHYTIFRLLHILLNREELMNITGGSNCINSQFTFTLLVIQFNIRTRTITITHLLHFLCITTTPHIFHPYIS